MFRAIPQFTVKNLKGSMEFYKRHLGFEATMIDPPANPVFVMLERDDASFFLVSEKSREEEYQQDDLKNNKRGVGVRIYLEVDDARKLYDKMKAAKVNINRDIAFNDRENYTEFSFLDPDGYEIGVYS